MLNRLMWTLAQTSQNATGPEAAPAGQQPAGGGASGLMSFLPFLLFMGVLFWLMTRSQRKQQQKVEEMRAGLKRNDRVQTVGGIIGTVVTVSESEVVLKVDETNNVKMRFARSAIGSVLTQETASER
ncbi:MAG: preprotein translocase subunit YajC [Phycisphaerales bacterium]|nr:preprotein translocase subunit YajC [Phycisphaerales bacterium]